VKIQDFSTMVILNTVKLVVDGKDVTTLAHPAKNADLVTLSYTPPTPWDSGTPHTYVVSFSDDSIPAKSFGLTNTFQATILGAPGQFVIEMEDFNFDRGQTKPAASVMPYLGGAYDGLGAVFNVDYSNDDALDNGGVNYRTGAGDLSTAGTHVDMDQGLEVNTAYGRNRGAGWDMTVNYKIGWAGNGNWQNYTRTFPSGAYNVYAALSHGNTNAHDLAGKLSLVSGGATGTAQTVLDLGTFDGVGTGGYGINALVPMKDAGGQLGSVGLAGAQTVRFTSTSGDMDYLVLRPTAAISVSIVTQPASVVGTLGGSASFNVTAAGTGPLTYQWLFQGVELPGQTRKSLYLPSLVATNAGPYTVRVTGGTGTQVLSDPAVLSFGGDQISLTVKANPDGSITVEWVGGGILQVNTDVGNPAGWTDVPTAKSPFTVTPTEKSLFGRIKR